MAKNGLLGRLQQRLLRLERGGSLGTTRQLSRTRGRRRSGTGATAGSGDAHLPGCTDLPQSGARGADTSPAAVLRAARRGRPARRDRLPLARGPHRRRFMREHSRARRAAPRLPLRARDMPQPKLRLDRQGAARPSAEVIANPARARAHARATRRTKGFRSVTRLNLVLLAIVVACGLALVTSQHRARKLLRRAAKSRSS